METGGSQVIKVQFMENQTNKLTDRSGQDEQDGSNKNFNPKLQNHLGALKQEGSSFPLNGNQEYFGTRFVKLLENCQRTSRVVIICELEKKALKDRKFKIYLHRLLAECNSKMRNSHSEVGYFKSINYSRIKMGKKQFLNKILLNRELKNQLFDILFSNKIQSSEKIRKNERSQVSLAERKKIIMKVVEEYKKQFLNFYTKQEEHSTILHDHENENEPNPDRQQSMVDASLNCKIEQNPSCLSFPIIPIALPAYDYTRYLQFKE